MEAVLIGYMPKLPTPRPDWLQAPAVEEVCSVSPCIAHPPDDWINRWLHNDLFVYDTPEVARSVADGRYLVYAWRLLPVVFSGEETPLEISGMQPAPLPADFRFLGYDVVSRSYSSSFECSPLSCNNMAAEVTTNRYCLLDDEAEAIAFARRCAVEQPEPGDYFVVEVWREG